MRPIWTGAISFGLVTIPVRLYSAVSQQRVKFRLLAAEDKKPVKYKRYSPTLGREVDWEEIVKGFEVSRGNYITFTKEELDELKPKRSDTIDVTEFVPQSALDNLHIDKHYFIAPQKTGQKAYYLLREALQESARVAIGRFVMREKEYVVAMQAYQEGLLLTTLTYDYEVRDIHDVPELGEEPEINEQELELARDLINKLSKDNLDMSHYEDTYEEQLRAAIERRERGEEAVEAERGITRDDELLAALQASLEA